MLKKILLGVIALVVIVIGISIFSDDEYDEFAKEHNMSRDEFCEIAADNGITLDSYIEMVNGGYEDELLTLDELKEFSQKYNISIEDIRSICEEQNLYVSDFVRDYDNYRETMGEW